MEMYLLDWLPTESRVQSAIKALGLKAQFAYAM